jgi:lipopolysaccharide transport system permease protein
MLGAIDGFRWAIIGGEVQIFWPGFLLSLLLVLVLLFTGMLYLCRMERTFADVI